MAHVVELSQEQFDNYSDDNVRAALRAEISERFSVSDTVNIVSPTGDIWDVMQGSLPDDGAVPISQEELDAKRALEVANAEHIEFLEKEIRPQVMQKLRSEARLGVRDEIRERTNEVLELRNNLAKQQISSNRQIESLSRENAGLKRRLSELEPEKAPDTKPDSPKASAS